MTALDPVTLGIRALYLRYLDDAHDDTFDAITERASRALDTDAVKHDAATVRSFTVRERIAGEDMR